MAECSRAAIATNRLEEFERHESSCRAQWSRAAWSQVVERSLPTFTAGLTDVTQDESLALIESYLSLVAEAIAQRALFPHPADDHPNIFAAVFERLIPKTLATVPGAENKAKMLASLWNLCEAVAQEPPWVEASMSESLIALDTLADFPARCRALQRELLEPRPQRVSLNTSPDALSYSTISLWPVGFFLPERIERCGPSVFFITGVSPGIARSFYLLVHNSPRVLSVSGHAAADAAPRSSESWVSTLVDRLTTFQLPLRSAAAVENGVAAVYSGSQFVHLWRVM